MIYISRSCYYFWCIRCIALYCIRCSLFGRMTSSNFFSPCCSLIGVHHLINLLSRTNSFLVTIPLSNPVAAHAFCRSRLYASTLSRDFSSVSAMALFLSRDFSSGTLAQQELAINFANKRKSRDAVSNRRSHPRSREFLLTL